MTSQIPSPYGHIAPGDRARIHSSISVEDFNFLFVGAFPRHGAQDRITSTLLHKFISACQAWGIPPFYSDDNEKIATMLLESLSFDTPEPEREYNYSNEHESD